MAAPGVRAWLHGETLVSSGCEGLDACLGKGGFPLRSLVLVLYDRPDAQRAAAAITSCFVAEGVARGHAVVGASPFSVGECAHDMMFGTGLPAVVQRRTRDKESDVQDDSLRIAWRYGQQSAPGATARPTLGLNFDLSKRISSLTLEKNPPVHVCIGREFNGAKMAAAIRTTIERRGCLDLDSNMRAPAIGRFVAFDLISPATTTTTRNSAHEALCFLHILRSITQQANLIGLVSIPAYAVERSVLEKMQRFFDSVICLRSFNDDEKLGDYDGTLTIERTTPETASIETPNFLYSVRLTFGYASVTSEFTKQIERRKLTVDKMQLPPERSRLGDEAAHTCQASISF